MNYTKFTVKETEYKLKLTTRSICELEKRLGYNPVNMVIEAADGRLPKVYDMVMVLHASLQAYNHGMDIDKVFKIFDAYLVEHSATDFIGTIVDIFTVSGLIRESNNDNDSNFEDETFPNEIVE